MIKSRGQVLRIDPRPNISLQGPDTLLMITMILKKSEHGSGKVKRTDPAGLLNTFESLLMMK